MGFYVAALDRSYSVMSTGHVEMSHFSVIERPTFLVAALLCAILQFVAEFGHTFPQYNYLYSTKMFPVHLSVRFP